MKLISLLGLLLSLVLCNGGGFDDFWDPKKYNKKEITIGTFIIIILVILISVMILCCKKKSDKGYQPSTRAQGDDDEEHGLIS